MDVLKKFTLPGSSLSKLQKLDISGNKSSVIIFSYLFDLGLERKGLKFYQTYLLKTAAH